MPKNKTTFIDLLVELAWWVAVIVAASTYGIMAHGLPNVHAR